MTTTRWCIACGSQNRPTPAVGVNHEGEPACIAHSGSGNSRESSVPTMSEMKRCPGFERDCQAMIAEKKELCSSCYARRHHRQNKKTTPAPKARVGNTFASIKADLLAKLAAIELVESLLDGASL